MQIPVIRKLCEQYTTPQLKEAEESLLNEQIPAIDVPGEDEGEQLTHVIAAIECQEDMRQKGLNAGQAIRNYTQRVRNSIG